MYKKCEYEGKCSECKIGEYEENGHFVHLECGEYVCLKQWEQEFPPATEEVYYVL